MSQVNTASLHVYTEEIRQIGVRAYRRYIDTANRLAALCGSSQYLDTEGLQSPAELKYLRHGGQPKVVQSLRRLQPERSSSSEWRQQASLTWSTSCSIGFHFAVSNRSRIHDVEIQCITSLEPCFSEEINKPHRNFETISRVQYAIETSDLIITPCSATRRELTEYFAVDPNVVFLAPPEPLTYDQIVSPQRPLIAVVLADGLASADKSEARQCAQFLREHLPQYDSVLCWDMENGNSKDQGLLELFDAGMPLSQPQKLKLISAAHATILIGSSPTTDGLMSEARFAQRLAAPLLRGYEPVDPLQRPLRYDVAPGAAASALKALVVTRPGPPPAPSVQPQEHHELCYQVLQEALLGLLEDRG